MSASDVRAVGDLQRRGGRLGAEVQLGVGLVGGEHEVVRAGQRGGALVERERRGRGRRVVRVVQPQHADAVPRGRGDRVEVGQEAVRRRAAAARAPRARRTPRRARGRGSPASVTADEVAARRPARGGRSPPWSRASGRPRVSGSSATPKRRPHPAPRSPRAARAGPRRAGRSRRGSIAAASASRMKRGVSSRGSPIAEVDEVDAAAASSAALRLGQARRTGRRAARRGRAFRPSSGSERARRHRGSAAQRARRARRPSSSRRCAWAGSPGPKLTASMPAGAELGHRGPRLLRRDRQVARARSAAATSGAVAADGARRGVGVDLELAVAAAQLAQARLGLLRRRGPARSGSSRGTSTAVGDDVVGDAAADPRDRGDLDELQPVEGVRVRRVRGERGDPRRGALDRVVGEPRPGGVARSARGTSRSR